MINHVRTLLLNVSTVDGFPPSFIGEELVPPDFIAKVLPESLQAVRNVLFGNSPDRLMLNYRLRQFMTLLHSNELEEFVLDKDPRVTYWPVEDQTLFSGILPEINKVDGTTPNLFLEGNPTIQKSANKLIREWNIEVIDGSTVEVVQLTAPIQTSSESYTISGGLSSSVPLGTSNLSFKFESGIGSKWNVVVYARPLYDPAVLVTTLQTTLAPTSIDAIFGAPLVTPFSLFKRLWQRHDELPYKLGGLLLGLAYRIDEL